MMDLYNIHVAEMGITIMVSVYMTNGVGVSKKQYLVNSFALSKMRKIDLCCIDSI